MANGFGNFFDPTDPSGGVNLDALMRAIQPGFFESPATARETGLRQAGQEQDLALNFARQLLGLQTGAQEQLARTRGEEERATIGTRAQFDPLAQLTAGVGRGQSLEGGALGDLMRILTGRFGGAQQGRLAGIESQERRQLNSLVQRVLQNEQNAILKLSADVDPGDEAGMQALQQRIEQVRAGTRRQLATLKKQNPKLAADIDAALGADDPLASRLAGQAPAGRSAPATIPDEELMRQFGIPPFSSPADPLLEAFLSMNFATP